MWPLAVKVSWYVPWHGLGLGLSGEVEVFLAVPTEPFLRHYLTESTPELANHNCSIMTYHNLQHCLSGDLLLMFYKAENE